MLFSEDSRTTLVNFDFLKSCGRCFYDKDDCKCDDLTLKNKKELLVKAMVKDERN